MKSSPMDVWKELGRRILKTHEELEMHSMQSDIAANHPLDMATIGTCERLAFLCKMRDELRCMFQENTAWTKA